MARSHNQLFDLLKVDANWQQLLTLPASDLTQAELQAAYWGLAVSEYGGRLEPAEISPSSAKLFLALRRPQGWHTILRDTLRDVGIEAYDGEKYQSTSQSRVDLSTLYDCESGFSSPLDPSQEPSERHGSIALVGQLVEGAGVLQLEYDNCLNLTRNLSGHSIAIGEPVHWLLDYMEFQGTEAFRDFKVDHPRDPVTGVDTSVPTGYVGYRHTQIATAEDAPALAIWQDALAIHGTDGERYLRRHEEIMLKEDLALVAAESVLSIASLGSAVVTYQSFEQSEDVSIFDDPIIYKYTFTGKGGASFAESFHVCGYTHITMDIDGNGVDDSAGYQPDYKFIDAESYPEFKPIGEVSHPPVITSPRGVVILPMENSGVVADIGTYYWDPDTPRDSLRLQYHWTINGAAHEPRDEAEYTGDDLVDGSWVTVFVTVSDGEHTIKTDEGILIYRSRRL